MRSLQVDDSEQSLHERLRSGAHDLWSGGTIRESSLWTDTSFFERLTALRDETDASSALGAGSLRRHRASRVVRTYAAWTRALLHTVTASVRRARFRFAQPDVDVMLVEYLPASYSRAKQDHSQYFGALPSDLQDLGYRVGVLHLHANGPVTSTNRAARRSLKALSGDRMSHTLVTDTYTVGAWWRALRTWRRISRRAPTERQIEHALATNAAPHGSDVSRLWGSWRWMYEDSVFGTHAVRTALLTEMFHSQVQLRSPHTLWVIAFEGQGWESCLARVLQAEARRWVPYLHTMMRPWDLRARTFLREISPEIIAVHGEHDASELGSLGVPLVTVEALRYAHLGNAQAADRGAKEGLEAPVTSPVSSSVTWLAVGGAECERSNLELRALLDSLHEAGVCRDIVVRWHPQCGQPTIPLGDWARVSTKSLVELQSDARVAILLGSAAPLDTYLQGIPTCAFVTPSGYDMSPVEQDARFQVFRQGSDLVRWALEMEEQPRLHPDISKFFVLDSALPRWKELVRSRVGR